LRGGGERQGRANGGRGVGLLSHLVEEGRRRGLRGERGKGLRERGSVFSSPKIPVRGKVKDLVGRRGLWGGGGGGGGVGDGQRYALE